MTYTDEIRNLLEVYESALNSSDTALAVSCYTSNGMFMPSGLPTVVGRQVGESYGQIFARIRLHVSFSIDEVVVCGEDVAYALTRSNGTQTTLESGLQSVESNREVFIFAREDKAWKISRYMFNQPR